MVGLVRLILIRHPQPDIEKGICYGASDVPLLEGWESSAAPLKAKLQASYPDAHYAHSPLQRASQLAHFLSGNSCSVSALKELDFGSWEGRSWNDIPEAEIAAWSSNLESASPYQGESLQDLSDRVLPWLTKCRQGNQDCVVVTHAGVIKVLVSHLCGWPLAQCAPINPTFLSVTQLTLLGDFVTLDRLGMTY